MTDFVWILFVLIFASSLINWQGNVASKIIKAPLANGTITPSPNPSPTHSPIPPGSATNTPIPTTTLTPVATNTPTPTLAPYRTSVSNSKLGIFILGDSPEIREVLRAGPKVVKVMDVQDHPAVMQKIREYKQMYPDGIVVLRVFTPQDSPRYYHKTISPEDAANDYFNILKTEFDKIDPQDVGLFDYLSGPNENENFAAVPMYQDINTLQWMNRFWKKFAENIRNDNRIKPLLGEIPVGNLKPEDVSYLKDGLEAINTSGGAWSYHGYSLDRTKNVNEESGESLRHRSFYSKLQSDLPHLQSVPIIISEAGFDNRNPQSIGWKQTSNATDYLDWLSWYDDRLQEDNQVIGATIFQIGSSDPKWSSFDLKDIHEEFRDYLINKNISI